MTINIDAIRDTGANFCRVFEMPPDYPPGFCFGGGLPVRVVMVDWFNPIPPSVVAVAGEHGYQTWEQCRTAIIEFVRQKRYVKPGRRYVIVTEFGEAMTFEGAP